MFSLEHQRQKHDKKNKEWGLLQMPEPEEDSWVRIKNTSWRSFHPLPLESSACLSQAELRGSLAPSFGIMEFWVTLLRHSYRVLVAQSCPTLCNPMDCSPPGSSIHGILQARVLEWAAIPFSGGSSPPRDRTPISCIASGFFAIWATRETQSFLHLPLLLPTTQLITVGGLHKAVHTQVLTVGVRTNLAHFISTSALTSRIRLLVQWQHLKDRKYLKWYF